MIELFNMMSEDYFYTYNVAIYVHLIASTGLIKSSPSDT
jgi:hypothetical protein